MEKMYFHYREIDTVALEARPAEDLGFDNDKHEDYVLIGGTGYRDSEPVLIDDLMSHLNRMKTLGANYVCLDWHVDHQNVEVTGIEYRLATAEEALQHRIKIAEAKAARQAAEIQKLEERLKQLKQRTQ